MPDAEKPTEIAALAVQLLSAYLSNNTVAPESIAELIRSTKIALVEEVGAPAEAEAEPVQVPAVSARKSLASSGHILSMIDGKPYKVLKRHLAKHGLTPDAYRERYNLPSTYPMVAPDFAAHRRSIAQKIGLGSKGRAARIGDTAASPAELTPSEASEGLQTTATSAVKGGAPKAKRISKPKREAKNSVVLPSASAPLATEPAQPLPEVAAIVPKVQPAQKRQGRKPSASSKPKDVKEKAKGAGGSAVPARSQVKAQSDDKVPTAKPSRRSGKLGLFGVAGSADGAATDTGPATAEPGNTLELPGKPLPKKRMARSAAVKDSKDTVPTGDPIAN